MNTYGTELAATYVGRTTDDDGWAHFAWTVTLTRDGNTRTLPYRMGLGHVTTKCGKSYGWQGALPCQHVKCSTAGPQPTAPTLYDVLTGLKADSTDGETFADWCANYGYDTDSRKAMDTYLACQQSEDDSRRFFGADWPTVLSDEDYE